MMTQAWLRDAFHIATRDDLVAWSRDVFGGAGPRAYPMAQIVAVMGSAVCAQIVSYDDAWQAILLAGKLAQDAYGSWDDFATAYARADTAPLQQLRDGLWAELPWHTELGVTVFAPGATRVLQVTCPTCSAPRTRPLTSAYVYCDCCGQLEDFDVSLALAQPLVQPGPIYERLLAQVAPELAAARDRGDVDAYRAVQRRLLTRGSTRARTRCRCGSKSRVSHRVRRVARRRARDRRLRCRGTRAQRDDARRDRAAAIRVDRRQNPRVARAVCRDGRRVFRVRGAMRRALRRARALRAASRAHHARAPRRIEVFRSSCRVGSRCSTRPPGPRCSSAPASRATMRICRSRRPAKRRARTAAGRSRSSKVRGAWCAIIADGSSMSWADATSAINRSSTARCRSDRTSRAPTEDPRARCSSSSLTRNLRAINRDNTRRTTCHRPMETRRPR